MIEAAFYSETVPQIRQQFASALGSLTAQASVAAEPPAEQAKSIYDKAYVKSLRHVTERVLHQLNPLIGDIEQKASTEIVDFEASETKTRIGQIKLQFEAIEKLYNAAKPAVIEEFDLATVIRDCLPHDLDHNKCLLSFAGPAPSMVQGDPSLITIAVTNGLRNAIEACLPVATSEHKPPIVINWDATDRITGYRSSMKVSAFTAASPGLSRLARAAKAIADTAYRACALRWSHYREPRS